MLIEISDNEMMILKELRMVMSNDEGFLRVDWNRSVGKPKIDVDVKKWLNKE